MLESQNVTSIAASAPSCSLAQLQTGSNTNTELIKPEDFKLEGILSLVSDENSSEIAAPSLLTSPTVSLARLSLKGAKEESSKLYTQKLQTNDKFFGSFPSSPIRRAMNRLIPGTSTVALPSLLSTEQSYHLSSDDVRALALIAANALKSSNKDTCLLNTSNYFLGASLSNEDVKTLATITVKALRSSDLILKNSPLRKKLSQCSNTTNSNIETKELNQRGISFSGISEKRQNKTSFTNFASNTKQKKTFNNIGLI